MSCLLIDDDTDDQEIFLLCLNEVRPDVKCLLASDGAEAIDKLRSRETAVPDVIFLDINMPKMNGLECLAELKKMQKLSHSFIFIYSTTADESVKKRSAELGADDYIVKPAEAGAIKSLLKAIFAKTQRPKK